MTDTVTMSTTVATTDTPAWTPPTWEEIVAQHSGRVYRLAYRLTGNPHDAEDLTHDVFIRVFRSLHAYQPGTFEGWLHRITTNVFLDKMRRKQRIRFDALPEDAAYRMASAEPGPEQVYDQTHFGDDVQRALAQLSPEFRAAVVLCDIEGLSYEEIAATLGIKLGTVLTLALPHATVVVRVLAFAERRGSFTVAQQLYERLDGGSGDASLAEAGDED